MTVCVGVHVHVIVPKLSQKVHAACIHWDTRQTVQSTGTQHIIHCSPKISSLYLCWDVPHTCCPGTPPPAWQRSSPPAVGWGVCPSGWLQGIHSHSLMSAILLSWWDEASGMTLWRSQAQSIPTVGHTEHVPHRRLERENQRKAKEEMSVVIDDRSC